MGCNSSKEKSPRAAPAKNNTTDIKNNSNPAQKPTIVSPSSNSKQSKNSISKNTEPFAPSTRKDSRPPHPMDDVPQNGSTNGGSHNKIDILTPKSALSSLSPRSDNGKSLSMLAREKLISEVTYGEVIDDSPASSPEHKERSSSKSVTTATILMTVDELDALLWARDLVSQTIAKFGEINPPNVIVPLDITSESLLFLLTSCKFERSRDMMVFDFSSRPDSVLARLCALLVDLDVRLTDIGACPIPIAFCDNPKIPYVEFGPAFKCTFTAEGDEVFANMDEWISKKGDMREVIAKGNWKKFTQNGRLRGMLLSTGNAPLIYCNPNNGVLGAQTTVEDILAHPYDRSFKGKNAFGESLRMVRTTLVKKLS